MNTRPLALIAPWWNTRLRRAWIAAILVILIVLPVTVGNSYWVFITTQFLIYSMAVIGLNVLMGYSGQISLGQGALMGLAGYAFGILYVDHGWNFVAAGVAGVFLSVILGLLFLVPSLRMSNWYFAVITLIIAIVFEQLVFHLVGLTHGFAGLLGTGASIGGVALNGKVLYWVVIAFVALSMWCTYNLTKSRFGRAFIGIRDGQTVAECAGVNVVLVRVLAFAYSAVLTGIAGVLFTLQKGVLSPDDFSFMLSADLLIAVILGGLGQLWGGIVGAAIFFAIPQVFNFLAGYLFIVYGVLLLVIGIGMPQGVVGGIVRLTTAVSKRGRVKSAPADEPSRGFTLASNEGFAVGCEGLVKSFMGVKAIQNVSLQIKPKTIHAIVGPNGSGKTTLLNMLSGVYSKDEGSIEFDRSAVEVKGPAAYVHRGVARTFQTPKLLKGMTARENVLFGAYPREHASLLSILGNLPKNRRESASMATEADNLLAMVGLAGYGEENVDDLSHSEHRLIEIARALMAHPRLLLLDEPAAGLSLGELDRVGELFGAIRAAGVTTIIVEHQLGLVRTIADEVTVLGEGGRIIANGPPGTVLENDDVRRSFIGSTR